MPPTARERARAELTREIKERALRQLAETGAAQLSLRAIARDLGMVSSALYRYFGSRDELLTALIIDAYQELADAVTAASPVAGDQAGRWTATASALRDWAVAEPHRFTLIYGSPVPGYRAPADTVGPAMRVLRGFTSIVAEAATSGVYDGVEPPHLEPELVDQLTDFAAQLGPTIPAHVLDRAVGAFAQLIGMVNLELAGHFVGGFEPADALFRRTVALQVELLGLSG